MPFTGRLGTQLSQLGNIELGTLGSSATIHQVQARANIYGVTTRTVQARANLRGITIRGVTAKGLVNTWSPIITDSFNRVDQAPLGTADSGQVWTDGTSLHYSIVSNQAKCLSGSFTGGSYLQSGFAGTTNNPILLGLDLFNTGDGAATGVVFRSGGPSDNNQFFAYLIKVAGVYNIRLIRELGGSFSGGTLYDAPVVGVTVNDSETHTLKVILQDARISVWLDDTLQVRTTDSNLTGNVAHGIFISDSGSTGRVDNFGVYLGRSGAVVSARAFISNGYTLATRTVQARANLRNTGTRSVQAGARITGRRTATVQARAYLWPLHFAQVSARAKIQATTTRTVSAKARITRPQATVTARARITAVADQTVSARARLLLGTQQQVTARAHLLGATITLTAEVTFNVGNTVTLTVPVRFDVSAGTRSSGWASARASIKSAVTLTVPVEFDVSYTLPTPPVLRPTQRSLVRTRRTCMARAHIIGGRLS